MKQEKQPDQAATMATSKKGTAAVKQEKQPEQAGKDLSQYSTLVLEAMARGHNLKPPSVR